MNLTESQRGALQAGFKYIDRLLGDGLLALSPDSREGAVFPSVAPDLTAAQGRVVAAQVARLRRSIRSALAACGAPPPRPEAGAARTLRALLVSVQVALDEMGPECLRGYGPLPPDAEAGVAACLAPIRAAAAELEGYLAGGPGGDIAARLARLDRTAAEVRLLAEIDRVVAAHGLVEFRLPIQHLLERLEGDRWTAAFVGRVSCGKSSLLNFLLGTDALPSGVTPVTAVPVRIVAGAEPSATVRLGSGRSERIPASELARYAAEDANPDNERGVADILLELPAPRLAGKVCLVDTPGLGSLATGGAAQTFAFLPRCDLGVLMIDAGSAPAEDDVAAARSLREAGAEMLVVLSKADLVAQGDLEKMRAHVARRLGSSLGVEVPVGLVSVAPGREAAAERWWRETFEPIRLRHAELAAAATRRRALALREAVVASLERKAGRPAASSAPSDALARLGAVRAAIDAARRKAYDLSVRALPSAGEIRAAAAAGPAGARPRGDLAAGLAGALDRAAAAFAGRFDALLEELRSQAQEALLAVSADRSAAAALPRPASRPLFDPAPLVASFRPPAFWPRWPTAFLRRAALRRALRSRLARPLDESLRRYGEALVRWTQGRLDELERHLGAQAGLVEGAMAPAGAGEPGGPGPASETDRDLARLRGWDPLPAA